MSGHKHPWEKSYPEDLDWNMPFETASLYSMLERTVSEHGDKTAVNFLGKRYSWGQIGEMVDHFAAGLEQQGIGKGDHVGLFLPNCPYYVIAYFAILKRGGTVVNFNPLYAEWELENQMRDSEVKMMVTLDLKMVADKMYKMLDKGATEKVVLCKFTDALPFPKNVLFRLFKAWEIATTRQSPNVLTFEGMTHNDGVSTPVEIDPDNDIAVLQYTGGTTGVPKGAMLTHTNLYANTLQSYAQFPQMDRQQKMLAVLPFFHVFAMTVCLNVAVRGGMEIIAVPRFIPDDTLALIQKERPDYMPGVPAIFNAFLTHKKIDLYDLSSLIFCISGGAPLPVAVKHGFEEKTGAVVVEGYGLSETSPVTHVNPPEGKNIAGSIGLPLPLTIAEIIDPTDKRTKMKPGEAGEICIRGPQVMKGYWKQAAETENVLRPTGEGDMRLYTGDIGIMEEDGYFYITDRIKDMINVNGLKVSPRKVEEAIYLHPAVEECIVAGIKDEKTGETVKVWIKCREGWQLTEDDLREHLKDKIAKFETPTLIEFRSEGLPKTLIGKLSRKEVKAQELGNF